LRTRADADGESRSRQGEIDVHRNHLMPCLVMLGAVIVITLMWGMRLDTLALSGVMWVCPLATLVMLRTGRQRHHTHGDHRARSDHR
jgi:hypothetical protein